MPSRSDLYARWSLEHRRARAFSPGDRVGVAVSGGPDSVLLLDFLRQLARGAGLILAVVHFNHRLRGAESNEDERFVESLARRLSLELFSSGADVARVARERRKNLEATARELRYEFFLSLVRQGKLDKIATGHTATDQAETVLLRLLRGAGTRGLGGIFPSLEGKVIRPFLSLTRAEIEAEIERRHLSFRLDRSNLDPHFSRTRVRSELIPLIEKRFNPSIVTLLKSFADRARDDEACLERQAAEVARPWRCRDGNAEKIPTRPLAQFAPALQRRVLRQMISSAAGNLRGVTAGHIESLRRFAAEAKSGKMLTLPGGSEALVVFDWLVVRPRAASAPREGFCYEIFPPSEIAVPGCLIKFRFETAENLERIGPEAVYNSKQGGYVDADKLLGELRLRSWREGDRLDCAGSSKPKKLKEFFAKRKIPLDRRRCWPVLVSGAEIAWARGLPPAKRVVVSPGTQRVLVIEEEPAAPLASREERTGK